MKTLILMYNRHIKQQAERVILFACMDGDLHCVAKCKMCVNEHEGTVVYESKLYCLCGVYYLMILKIKKHCGR